MNQNTTAQVIQAAIEVHRQLGRGLAQNAYVAALKSELSTQGIEATTEKSLDVYYKGESICETKVDMWVPFQGRDALLISVCDDPKSDDIKMHHMRSLLKATEQEFGIVLNFGFSKMVDGIRKVNKNYKPKDPK